MFTVFVQHKGGMLNTQGHRITKTLQKVTYGLCFKPSRVLKHSLARQEFKYFDPSSQ